MPNVYRRCSGACQKKEEGGQGRKVTTRRQCAERVQALLWSLPEEEGGCTGAQGDNKDTVCRACTGSRAWLGSLLMGERGGKGKQGEDNRLSLLAAGTVCRACTGSRALPGNLPSGEERGSGGG